jgi:2-C-methyl-D-erythritol 4-phosphate cytidylyltransferase
MSSAPDPREVSVLIPAAGLGERMGLGPKALMPLAGRPLVEWVCDKARRLGAEVLVACAPGMAAPAGTLGVEGGATRQESVLRLAERASRRWTLLWDAASPFASLALAQRVLAAAAATGAATPCLTAPVRWFTLEDGRVTGAQPGTAAGWSQTPQAFATTLLRDVTARAAREGWTGQSTVDLMLRAGVQVTAVPGERLNLKLTTPDDWLLAQALHAQLQS